LSWKVTLLRMQSRRLADHLR